MEKEKRLARALGWFGIGLGLAELLAPRQLADTIGVPATPESQNLFRSLGVREIASGVGILKEDRPFPGMTARVAGDVMDLALLGKAFRADDTQRKRVAWATAAVVGVTILDILCCERLRH